jgi:hypothetical protein
MAPLMKYSYNREKRFVMYLFLWSEDLKISDIYGTVTLPCGDNCKIQREVQEWVDDSEDEQVLLMMMSSVVRCVEVND